MRSNENKGHLKIIKHFGNYQTPATISDMIRICPQFRAEPVSHWLSIRRAATHHSKAGLWLWWGLCLRNPSTADTSGDNWELWENVVARSMRIRESSKKNLVLKCNDTYSHPQIDGKVNHHQISRHLLFHLFGDDYTRKSPKQQVTKSSKILSAPVLNRWDHRLQAPWRGRGPSVGPSLL